MTEKLDEKNLSVIHRFVSILHFYRPQTGTLAYPSVRLDRYISLEV